MRYPSSYYSKKTSCQHSQQSKHWLVNLASLQIQDTTVWTEASHDIWDDLSTETPAEDWQDLQDDLQDFWQ